MSAPEHGDTASLTELFAALANSDRIGIVDVLWRDGLNGGRGVTVSGIARELHISRFGASHHLGILRDVGVVEARRHRNSILNSLAVGPLMTIWDWIERIDETLHSDDTTRASSQPSDPRIAQGTRPEHANGSSPRLRVPPATGVSA